MLTVGTKTAPYSNDEEGKLVEQRLATQMQRDHGAGGNLIKHSDAWDVVQTEIKTLVDEFDESKQNPEVFQLLEKMGSQVWKSAINLRNQKGSILFTFSPENTRDIIESLDSVGIVWFPQVTINKPRHAYDRSTHEQEVVSEVHEALHAPHPHSSKRLTRHTRELDNLLEVGLLHPKPIPVSGSENSSKSFSTGKRGCETDRELDRRWTEQSYLSYEGWRTGNLLKGHFRESVCHGNWLIRKGTHFILHSAHG